MRGSTVLKWRLLDSYLRATVGPYSSNEVAKRLLKHFRPTFSTTPQRKKRRGTFIARDWNYRSQWCIAHAQNSNFLPLALHRNAKLVYAIQVRSGFVFPVRSVQIASTICIDCIHLSSIPFSLLRPCKSVYYMYFMIITCMPTASIHRLFTIIYLNMPCDSNWLKLMMP